MDINNCVAIVTGGASGLGMATANHILSNHGKVAVFDVGEFDVDAFVTKDSQRILYCQVDITDESTIQEGIDKAIKSFGAVNVLVNCAGVNIPQKVISKDKIMDMSKWIKTISINLIGTMQTIRLVSAQMAKNEPNVHGEKGVIVNTASIAAFEGQMGQSAYAASKAGIVGMTLPLAREFSNIGIRVMTIAPGTFLTPMISALPEKVQESLGQSVPFPKRMGNPNEFAMLVAQIIENPMLNGETIRLDGALRMSSR